MAADRLSELHDDILRRILHFAPLKEAASTRALSRRWRKPLWLSSGAVNLETGDAVIIAKKPRLRRHPPRARFFSGSHDDLVSAAMGALDAAVVPVKRLTLTTMFDNDKAVSCYKDLVDDMLSHRATRRIEDLRLVAKDAEGKTHGRREQVFWQFTPNLQQSETLRILELTNCSGLLDHKDAVFPLLSSLRLSHCYMHLGYLQRVMDAAPGLAVVRLETVRIDATDHEAEESTRRSLRCPATTTLVLDSCSWPLTIVCSSGGYDHKAVDSLEIDATRLRRFSYKGSPHLISFSPQPLGLEQVDLELNGDLETFWRCVRNFTSTKEMMLKVNQLEDITVVGEARQVQLLPAFHRLERLECQGAYWTKDKTTPLTTIMNLLHCCPVLSALRINLTPKYEEESEEVPKPTTRKEILTAAMAGPRYLFQCLQTSLRRVDLQFQLEKKDCFGLKLMKIFAENAMVLDEMRIAGGDKKLCGHMTCRIEKWNSSRRELGATSFVLLPLKG